VTRGWASALLPAARLLDPETAHKAALLALRCGLAGRDHSGDDPVLAVSAFGRVLCNPIGLAAGFDKDAVALNALSRLGFGFVEAGTVTPLPQPGNARPRLFRLEKDAAVITRMGFNNSGIEAFVARLRHARRGQVAVGANIGINKDGALPERDYPALAAALDGLVDYITINVSSPNTPGLRNLQTAASLSGILDAMRTSLPLLVKIAPDLLDDALASVVEVCVARGVRGLIISNTTIARPALRSAHAGEAGGLSGKPLFAPSTAMLKQAFGWSRGRLTLIGVGGIFSAADAFEKILAGAALVQVYTGFAYQGPAMIPRLKKDLARLVKARGFANVGDAVGAGV
jgi:dihydroorotate dehydrogenase